MTHALRIEDIHRGSVDLHGLHPHDGELHEAIEGGLRAASEAGLSELTFIHGHGFNRANYVATFTNSNTGYLGQTVRSILRHDSSLRAWMLAKFDCSDIGATTVRIRRG